MIPLPHSFCCDEASVACCIIICKCILKQRGRKPSPLHPFFFYFKMKLYWSVPSDAANVLTYTQFILEMQQVSKGGWCVCSIWYFFIGRKWFLVSNFVIGAWNISAKQFIFQEILPNLCWILFSFKKISSPLLLWRWSLNRTVLVSIKFVHGNFDRLQQGKLLLLAEFANGLARFALWKGREALRRNNEA